MMPQEPSTWISQKLPWKVTRQLTMMRLLLKAGKIPDPTIHLFYLFICLIVSFFLFFFCCAPILFIFSAYLLLWHLTFSPFLCSCMCFCQTFILLFYSLVWFLSLSLSLNPSLFCAFCLFSSCVFVYFRKSSNTWCIF